MPKQPPESPTPEIVTSTIAELNLLAGASRSKVVAAFNKIPPEERTRTNLETIIEKTDKRIIIAIVRAWYPEKAKLYKNGKIPEVYARQFLRQIIMANPDNFFARINRKEERVSATGKMAVFTANNLSPVTESTRMGCLRALNPWSWFKSKKNDP